jgi:hypothetical protein
MHDRISLSEKKIAVKKYLTFNAALLGLFMDKVPSRLFVCLRPFASTSNEPVRPRGTRRRRLGNSAKTRLPSIDFETHFKGRRRIAAITEGLSSYLGGLPRQVVTGVIK